jgi:hypothetical protein
MNDQDEFENITEVNCTRMYGQKDWTTCYINGYKKEHILNIKAEKTNSMEMKRITREAEGISFSYKRENSAKCHIEGIDNNLICTIKNE